MKPLPLHATAFSASNSSRHWTRSASPQAAWALDAMVESAKADTNHGQGNRLKGDVALSAEL